MNLPYKRTCFEWKEMKKERMINTIVESIKRIVFFSIYSMNYDECEEVNIYDEHNEYCLLMYLYEEKKENL